MTPFRNLTSTLAPLDRSNVQDGASAGQPDSSFILNNTKYKGAEILIAGKNFGCGSSREHAAWALSDYGFRCVIAPSFADIFFSNAGKNGILLVRLPEEQVHALLERSAQDSAYKLHISLEEQTVRDNAGFSAKFEIDPFRKYCLLEGLDDIGLTMRHENELDAFESKHNEEFWVAPRPLAAATAR
jgi:3-isopropylmalate/(R)-2-methylmalate dehydratase small subunit